MMLQTFHASKLLDLRNKTRIFVPSGRSMMGCLDETRTLEYGQVFVQFSLAKTSVMLSLGRWLLLKTPACTQVTFVSYVPLMCQLCTIWWTALFSHKKGERSRLLRGSDWDGDNYFVCWDSNLIPPQQVQPMDYTPAPTFDLDHEVTNEEVEEYFSFSNYIVNDSLGITANAHTVFANREPNKAMSGPCLELAKLFSVAVDFPKAGIRALLPSHLRVTEYPDFMEKPDKITESQGAIGKLFREVKTLHRAPIMSSLSQRKWQESRSILTWKSMIFKTT
ncbi:hypothetical protein RJ639_047782 [Escallonia herrerae]|uniref:RNA-dependent RNA polymerase n=1 Tax=Escallonia herrerae TaxID=1293975 RepID=A0AA88WGA4_9ASTE|nr:hypothetical protein RJ639_047782 [Escallonia herrerae]